MLKGLILARRRLPVEPNNVSLAQKAMTPLSVPCNRRWVPLLANGPLATLLLRIYIRLELTTKRLGQCDVRDRVPLRVS